MSENSWQPYSAPELIIKGLITLISLKVSVKDFNVCKSILKGYFAHKVLVDQEWIL
jgi:hypothetical protein